MGRGGRQRNELADVTAKGVIYEAFVKGKLEAPKHLARTVHDLYFEPKSEEFKPQTIFGVAPARLPLMRINTSTVCKIAQTADRQDQ
jgi:hypothetical protein